MNTKAIHDTTNYYLLDEGGQTSAELVLGLEGDYRSVELRTQASNLYESKIASHNTNGSHTIWMFS